MSKKHFRRWRICKAALPDVTIRNDAIHLIGLRASRRRRYSEKALPVVTICKDAVNKDAFEFLNSGERPLICRVFSTHGFVGCVT